MFLHVNLLEVNWFPFFLIVVTCSLLEGVNCFWFPLFPFSISCFEYRLSDTPPDEKQLTMLLVSCGRWTTPVGLRLQQMNISQQYLLHNRLIQHPITGRLNNKILLISWCIISVFVQHVNVLEFDWFLFFLIVLTDPVFEYRISGTSSSESKIYN